MIFDSVVIIESDPISVFLYKKVISQYMIREPSIFTEVRSAIRFITEQISNGQQFPDIILLDPKLLEPEAFEFMDELSGLPIHPTIIVITNFISGKDRERLRTYDVLHILDKPLTRDKFEQVLHQKN